MRLSYASCACCQVCIVGGTCVALHGFDTQTELVGVSTSGTCTRDRRFAVVQGTGRDGRRVKEGCSRNKSGGPKQMYIIALAGRIRVSLVLLLIEGCMYLSLCAILLCLVRSFRDIASGTVHCTVL